MESCCSLMKMNVPIRCCSFKTRLVPAPKRGQPPRRARKAPPTSSLRRRFCAGRLIHGWLLFSLGCSSLALSLLVIFFPYSSVSSFGPGCLHAIPDPRHSFCEPPTCPPARLCVSCQLHSISLPPKPKAFGTRPSLLRCQGQYQYQSIHSHHNNKPTCHFPAPGKPPRKRDCGCS